MPFKNTLIEDDSFWSMLQSLEQMNGPTRLDIFLSEVGIDESHFIKMVSFLDYFNFEVPVYKLDDHTFIRPPGEDKKIQFEMSFSEWLAFQSHFPKIAEESKKAFHEPLATKLKLVEKENKELDLFRVIDEMKQKSHALSLVEVGDQKILDDLEQAINSTQVTDIRMKNDKVISIHIHRILFLDGGLSIIAEECHDRCLVYFRVDEIIGVTSDTGTDYKANYSTMEVNDFILAMRAVNGKEERLILKVLSEKELDLTPNYHFLGNSFLTTSPAGEKIWAASIEVTEELFEWLYSIKEDVEVLDPVSIKEEFEGFCAYKADSDTDEEEDFNKAA